MHEYIHAIKRYLGICTNGLISSETLDENEDKDEAGYFYEYYVFGWHKMKLSNFCESFPEKGNNNLKNGFFDIPTALNILNQENELKKDTSKICANRDSSIGNKIRTQFNCGNIRNNI